MTAATQGQAALQYEIDRIREAQQRPTCAVHGLIRRNAMCGAVIVGGVYCGHSGPCQHKVEPLAKSEAA